MGLVGERVSLNHVDRAGHQGSLQGLVRIVAKKGGGDRTEAVWSISGLWRRKRCGRKKVGQEIEEKGQGRVLNLGKRELKQGGNCESTQKFSRQFQSHHLL